MFKELFNKVVDKVSSFVNKHHIIKDSEDYVQRTGREILNKVYLKPGEESAFDRDIGVQATVLPENGKSNESIISGDKAKLGTFLIAANPTVRFEETQNNKFNATKRAIEKAKYEIYAVEDANVFAALEAAGTIVNELIELEPRLSYPYLRNIKNQIERNNLRLKSFVMSPIEFNDILCWDNGISITFVENKKTGLRARIWGCDIYVSNMVPEGTVFGVADKHNVGVLSIREDVKVVQTTDKQQLKDSYLVYEHIGIGVFVPRGVVVAKKKIAGNPVPETFGGVNNNGIIGGKPKHSNPERDEAIRLNELRKQELKNNK